MSPVKAQTADSLAVKQPIEVDFLLNYYRQDGEHAAVTGGRGTEALTDRAARIIVHLPKDSLSDFEADVAVNHYTSASTDRIDRDMSSASASDSRAQVNLAYSWRRAGGRQFYGLQMGGSIESDYLSGSLGGSWGLNAPNDNRQWRVHARAYWDNWIIYLPEELRDSGLVSIPTSKRRTYQAGVLLSQVVNTRLQLSFSTELIFQHGWLSTPFHRIYRFNDSSVFVDIERMPARRLKWPLAVRAHYFFSDFLVLRSYGRLYVDTFGIWAYTLQLEMPLKVHLFLSLHPFVRLHSQSAARFFRPFQGHTATARYGTSDYDLSAFRSLQWGLGLNYSPLYGLARFKAARSGGRITLLKSLELRFARYQRTDGLHNFLLSLDLGFQML
ncbi:MAG: DUF3570 domain-containing protein [Bacteroidetes bacterium]|nr:MAG: DUF3570 domain-containing protein [Bacteroidota bacterium]